MKQIYLTAVLLLLCALLNCTVLHPILWRSGHINWELHTNNPWHIKSKCLANWATSKSNFDSAATQPNAIITDTINFYPTNDTSDSFTEFWLMFGIGAFFALQWKQKLDMDTAHDGGIIEYSVDNGNTWVNVSNNPYVYNFMAFKQPIKTLYRVGNLHWSWNGFNMERYLVVFLICLGYSNLIGMIPHFFVLHYCLIP